MNIPDSERAARIQLLKEQVRNGTYKVDASEVAQSMLRDLIKDLLTEKIQINTKMPLVPTPLFFHKNQNHK
jgi:hypothetical protein